MTERIRIFDIIKGLCICMVLLDHFPLPGEETAFYYHYIVQMAVPFFMMVSGYLFAASMERKGIKNFEDAYSCKVIVPQLLRYTIPYAVVFAVYTVYCVRHYYVSFSTKLIEFVTGTIGMGGYYFPLLIQLVFLFPAIFFIMKKNPSLGIVRIFGLVVLYEFIQRTYNINEGLYRLLVFRYLLHIAFGAYAYWNIEKISRYRTAILALIGAGYMYVVSYTAYQPKIIRFWTATSFFTAFYCFFLFYLMLRYLPKLRFFPVEIIGRASYHIFLVQALYYGFFFGGIQERFSGILACLGVTFGICLGLGILFYLIESALTGKLLRALKKPLDALDLLLRQKFPFCV